MSAYLHALGSVPVHVGALTDFLRTRAKWLRIDTVRNVSGSWDVYLRVGGPYATPTMAFEAARHARDFCGVPIGTTTPDEPTITTKEQTHAR
jgi:hypothetical protein